MLYAKTDYVFSMCCLSNIYTGTLLCNDWCNSVLSAVSTKSSSTYTYVHIKITHAVLNVFIILYWMKVKQHTLHCISAISCRSGLSSFSTEWSSPYMYVSSKHFLYSKFLARCSAGSSCNILCILIPLFRAGHWHHYCPKSHLHSTMGRIKIILCVQLCKSFFIWVIWQIIRFLYIMRM